MCDDPEAAEAGDVLGDIAGFAGERVRRRRHVDRDVVPSVGADFDSVDAEHPVAVDRGIGRTRAVAMVCENDELQACSCSGSGHDLRRAAAVGSGGVDVQDPGDAPVVPRRRQQCLARRQGKERQNSNGGRKGRRRQQD